MHPALLVAGCHALGAAVLVWRGGGRRDPLIAAAFGFPLGAAVTLLLAAVPLPAPGLVAVWAGLCALAVLAARRQLRAVWRWPAAIGLALAAVAFLATRIDVAVVDRAGHDLLLAAALKVAAGEWPAGAVGCLHVLPAVLAASALIAVTAFLARTGGGALALAGSLALATTFPVLRALVTLGSPAAPIMILACAAGFLLRAHHPRVPLLDRAALAELALAWVVTAGVIALLDWCVLVAGAAGVVAGPAQAARLLPLAAGNLLPYALLATAAVATAEMAGRRFGGAALAAGTAIAAAPYAVWLARFTFSGPQAQDIAFRPLLVAASAALVASGFAAALWLAARRRAARPHRALLIGLSLAAALAALIASHTILPGEYAPLHQLLALAALLAAAIAGREIASAIRSRRLAPAIAVAAALWSVAAGLLLARAHGDAWLLWSETGGSRYLTRRWSFAAPEPALAGAAMIVEPDLGSPAATALRVQRAAAPAPNIVLFSIDGLRRDRVGAYGYRRRALTPTIDRFAARGVRFTRAVSSFPTTQAFNSALLLGRYVDRSNRLQQPPGFRAEAVTRLLDRRDYHIFVKGWFDQRLKDRFDPTPYGIDTYAPKATRSDELEEPMEQGLARVAAHLAEARRLGRPALVWLHLLATHPMTGQGFRPHPDFDFGDAPMDRYESAVAGSDRWLAGLEPLLASNAGRPTVWILFSDHGVHESTRSRDLREPLIAVPLVIAGPGVAPRVDDTLVDVSLDLAATVVDLAGIAPPADYDGVSLAPILAGLPATPMNARLVPLSYAGTWSGAIHGRHKVLRQQGVMSLYDLVADPDETQNLIAGDAGRAYAMMAVADRELARRFRAAAGAREEGP